MVEQAFDLKETLNEYKNTERNFLDRLENLAQNEEALLVDRDMKFKNNLDRFGAKFEETTNTLAERTDCAAQLAKELNEVLVKLDERIVPLQAQKEFKGESSADKGENSDEIEDRGESSIDDACAQAARVRETLQRILNEYQGTEKMMGTHTKEFLDVLVKIKAAISTLQNDRASQMLAAFLFVNLG